MIDIITIVLIILSLICIAIAEIQLYFRIIKIEMAIEILVDTLKEKCK